MVPLDTLNILTIISSTDDVASQEKFATLMNSSRKDEKIIESI